MKRNIHRIKLELSEEELAILNKRRKGYLSGKSKVYSLDEVKEKLLKRVNDKY